MTIKNLLCFLLLSLVVQMAPATEQFDEPVKFTTSVKRVSPSEVDVVFTGVIDAGWHVYSVDNESGGPTPASIHFETRQGVKPLGGLRAVGNEIEKTDPVFNMKVKYFENKVSFVQRLRLEAQNFAASGYLEYGSCNDKSCMPPMQAEFTLKGSDGPASADAKDEKIRQSSEAVVSAGVVKDSDTIKIAKVPENVKAAWWRPSTAELRSFENSDVESHGLAIVFLMGFLGGLLALFTPCVWPVVPMTVSFFLHRSANRRRALREALLYGLSIIVIYVGFGLALTLWRGANALNALATDAAFNLFFFVLLLFFAASFLGGFEISLPSSWNNKVNRKAEATTGLLSIFLMAFTLVLVSFSCTGPIIGFLLAGISVNGDILSPAVGMSGFALALAFPFAAFALFPAWLKRMPKSGGWMNVIKVSLGFIELAFALKFLSVADMAYGWRLLDREVFLSLWIVIFALLGLYLLGKIRFRGDDATMHTGVLRFYFGVVSLAFSVYMLPGLWGAPLKAISAFAPPMYTQDFNLDKSTVEPHFKDYETGMAYAREKGKPVLLDFTGYGCVNCRKMEMAVWNHSSVKDILKNDYVLISLYVDDKTPLQHPQTIAEQGKQRVLRTVGDKWSYLERSKFGAGAQPFYVPVDNEGRPLNHSYAYKEDVDEYVQFLKKGIENYKHRNAGSDSASENEIQSD